VPRERNGIKRFRLTAKLIALKRRFTIWLRIEVDDALDLAEPLKV
jgi:hypothetical protein